MPEAQVVEAKAVAPQPIEPSRIQVVTSENFEQYVAEQTATPNADPVEAAKDEHAKIESEKPKEETEDVEADLGEHVPKDKKGKLNERFSELTKARKEAEARAEKAAEEAKALREEKLRIEREAAELKAKYEPPKSDELGPEPALAQFNDVNEYAKALKDWTAEKVRLDDKKAADARRQQEEREATAKAWEDRQKAAKKELADYEDVIAKSSVMVSNEVRDAILESEIGPKLLYHLASNPEVGERLAKMTVGRALKELGKLEASLTAQAKEVKSEAKTPVAELSKAPAPITPLRGASAPVGVKVDSDGNFYGSYEEYKAARAAGKIR